MSLPGGLPGLVVLTAIVNGQETPIYACWGLGMFSLMVCLLCGHRHHMLRSLSNAQQKDPARVSRAIKDHMVNKKACSGRPDQLVWNHDLIEQLHKQLPNDSKLLAHPRTPVVAKHEVEKYERILMGPIVDGVLCSRCGFVQPASNPSRCCNTLPNIEVKISKGEGIDIPFQEKIEDVKTLYSHDKLTFPKVCSEIPDRSKYLETDDFSEYANISNKYERSSDKATSRFGLQNEEILRVVGVLHLPSKEEMIKHAKDSRPFRARDGNYSELLIKTSCYELLTKQIRLQACRSI